MGTLNPLLSGAALEPATAEKGTLTVGGTMEKTGVLLLLAMAGAAWAWRLGREPSEIPPSLLVGLVTAIASIGVTAARPRWAPLSAPIGALSLGFGLGRASSWLDGPLAGPAIQCVAMSFATLVCFLAACRAGLGGAASKARLVAWSGLGAVVLCYLGAWLLDSTGSPVPLLHDAGLGPMALSVVVSAVAAVQLAASVDVVQAGAVKGAPKSREWYLALGLVLTLAWSYLVAIQLAVRAGSRE